LPVQLLTIADQVFAETGTVTTTPLSAAFEKTEREYRRRLAEFDLAAAARVLGVGGANGSLDIPFFGRTYRVGPAGVADESGQPPAFAVRVILLQLLIHCPARPPVGREEWTAFRDFPDAAPLRGYFAGRVEGGFLPAFHGSLPRLAAACARLPGAPLSGFPHDLAWRVEALPYLPLLLLCNEADEDLPAGCSLLFSSHADSFLDMECLTLLGEQLLRELRRGEA
jgi:hypothetical protein